MSQKKEITPIGLYKTAYRIPADWKDFLDEDVYNYHEVISRELSGPIPLQMGLILPFISCICGPSTSLQYMSSPSVLNLFWMNIASSGTGKTVCLKYLIASSVKAIINGDNGPDDFVVSRFTRAGLEDNLIATKGYCFVATDEGTIVAEHLASSNSKHETDISLLNQLFDGRGDRSTLAQNKHRDVPDNSTGVSISMQPEAFVHTLNSFGTSKWLDNGFGERFLFSAVKPYKGFRQGIMAAGKERREKYADDLLERVFVAIYNHHYEAGITYSFDKDADKAFDDVYNTYAEQFNYRWKDSDDESEGNSQPSLPECERSEINVRTKGGELVARLSACLWIYSNAFKCIAQGSPLRIPTKITAQYIMRADAIVRASYAKHETFTSSVLSKSSTVITSSLSKPRMTDTQRVVNAIIRSNGPLINIRDLQKNIRYLQTKTTMRELQRLEASGYGLIITRQQMAADKIVPFKNAFNCFIKMYDDDLDREFFALAGDPELNRNVYAENFDKSSDPLAKRILIKYHPNVNKVMISPESTLGGTVNEDLRIRKPYLVGKKITTALDTMTTQEPLPTPITTQAVVCNAAIQNNQVLQASKKIHTSQVAHTSKDINAPAKSPIRNTNTSDTMSDGTNISGNEGNHSSSVIPPTATPQRRGKCKTSDPFKTTELKKTNDVLNKEVGNISDSYHNIQPGQGKRTSISDARCFENTSNQNYDADKEESTNGEQSDTEISSCKKKLKRRSISEARVAAFNCTDCDTGTSDCDVINQDQLLCSASLKGKKKTTRWNRDKKKIGKEANLRYSERLKDQRKKKRELDSKENETPDTSTSNSSTVQKNGKKAKRRRIASKSSLLSKSKK